MTRIGIDAHVLDGKYQGTRTWILEILRRAPLLAPDVTFVVYSADADHVAGLLGPGVPFEHRVLPAGGPLGRNLRFWPAAIRRDRLDLLVTQYFSPPRDARRQLVVVHDVLFETHPAFFGWKTRWRNKLLVGWSVRRAGAVATVSEYSRREISRAYGRPAERISVIRNGVDAAAALVPGPLPQRVPAGTRFALMVGRLEPRKNLRTRSPRSRACRTRPPGWSWSAPTTTRTRTCSPRSRPNRARSIWSGCRRTSCGRCTGRRPCSSSRASARGGESRCWRRSRRARRSSRRPRRRSRRPVVTPARTSTRPDPDPVGRAGAASRRRIFRSNSPRRLGAAQVSRTAGDDSAVSFVTSIRRCDGRSALIRARMSADFPTFLQVRRLRYLSNRA